MEHLSPKNLSSSNQLDLSWETIHVSHNDNDNSANSARTHRIRSMLYGTRYSLSTLTILHLCDTINSPTISMPLSITDAIIYLIGFEFFKIQEVRLELSETSSSLNTALKQQFDVLSDAYITIITQLYESQDPLRKALIKQIKTAELDMHNKSNYDFVEDAYDFLAKVFNVYFEETILTTDMLSKSFNELTTDDIFFELKSRWLPVKNKKQKIPSLKVYLCLSRRYLIGKNLEKYTPYYESIGLPYIILFKLILTLKFRSLWNTTIFHTISKIFNKFGIPIRTIMLFNLYIEHKIKKLKAIPDNVLLFSLTVNSSKKFLASLQNSPAIDTAKPWYLSNTAKVGAFAAGFGLVTAATAGFAVPILAGGLATLGVSAGTVLGSTGVTVGLSSFLGLGSAGLATWKSSKRYSRLKELNLVKIERSEITLLCFPMPLLLDTLYQNRTDCIKHLNLIVNRCHDPDFYLKFDTAMLQHVGDIECEDVTDEHSSNETVNSSIQIIRSKTMIKEARGDFNANKTTDQSMSTTFNPNSASNKTLEYSQMCAVRADGNISSVKVASPKSFQNDNGRIVKDFDGTNVSAALTDTATMLNVDEQSTSNIVKHTRDDDLAKQSINIEECSTKSNIHSTSVDSKFLEEECAVNFKHKTNYKSVYNYCCKKDKKKPPSNSLYDQHASSAKKHDKNNANVIDDVSSLLDLSLINLVNDEIQKIKQKTEDRSLMFNHNTTNNSDNNRSAGSNEIFDLGSNFVNIEKLLFDEKEEPHVTVNANKSNSNVDLLSEVGMKTKISTTIIIMVQGFLSNKEHLIQHQRYALLPHMGNVDVHMLCWESSLLCDLSKCIVRLLSENLIAQAASIGFTFSALNPISLSLWPLFIIQYAGQLDNTWLVAKEKSQQAGRLLAHYLVENYTGSPVSLVGFSMGARLIFYCLEELLHLKQFFIVSDVLLAGLPVKADNSMFTALKLVVNGRFINAYSTNDMILGLTYRYMEWELHVAGLAPVKSALIENVDVTEIIKSHYDYAKNIENIMLYCNFGESVCIY